METPEEGDIADKVNVETMMWSKIPDAKFGFRMRIIFQMAEWKRKTSLRLLATDELLSITEAQLRSEVQAIGYDLSKIEGYDGNCKMIKDAW